MSVPEWPRWTLPEIRLCHWGGAKKDSSSSEALHGAFFEHRVESYHDAMHMFTDGLRLDARVGCAVHAGYITCLGQLLAEASIFTTELSVMKLAPGCIKSSFSNCMYKSFEIFSNSWSAFDTVRDVAADHPIVCKIFGCLALHSRRGQDIRFC